jgi:hypothetical protein
MIALGAASNTVGGLAPRKGVVRMVTWEGLFQFILMIIGVIVLDRRKRKK